MSFSLYPWDLYLSNPDGTQTIKLLSGVTDGLQIKWSPVDSRIAFSGTLNEQPGLYILDTETSENPYRVWMNLVDFDWSPDGTRIILIDKMQEDSSTYILDTHK